MVNTIAAKRQVILFDAPGIGRTPGQVPDNFQGWANDIISFVQALGFQQVDLLGFSLGARAVQMAALTRPQMVRKLILAGASPVMWTPESPRDVRDPKYMMGMATAKTYGESRDAFRLALCGESEAGRRQFDEYWQRLQERTAEPPMLEPLELEPGANNQIKAIMDADKPESMRWPDRLAELKMPVLVANGKDDLTLSTTRTLHLFNRLPNAQLVIYPNSGHGFLWQYAEMFGEQVNTFLDTDDFDF